MGIEWNKGEVAAAMDELKVRFDIFGRKAVENVANYAVKEGVKNAERVFSVNQKGSLKRSITHDKVRRVGYVYASKVNVGVVYARIQELGGTIYPRRAQFLRFEYPEGSGQIHYRRSVTLPERPYMRPAFKRTRAHFATRVSEAWLAVFGA